MNVKTSDFFVLRGELPKSITVIFRIIGGILFFVLWQIASDLHLLRNGVVSSPIAMVRSIPLVWGRYDLLGNALYSITLNLLGYLEAAAIGIPLGFLIGLQPWCRSLSERYVMALRYLPLSAMLGPFMLAFGIATKMKVQFLAFGLLVYVVPQVIQRIDEVEEVYLQTMTTIGGNSWHTIRYVYLPAVISRVFTDFVVLTGISWTYIIIAEVVNMSDGGIGALAYMFYRQSKLDEMYFVLAVIVFIGFIFDRAGKFIDTRLFSYKYAGEGKRS